MKHTTRLLALLLAFLTLTAAAACAQNNDGSVSVTTAGDVSTAEEVTTTPFEGLAAADYDGYTFRAADISTGTPDPVTIIFDVAEQTGEAVYDAIYTRNRAIEAKYNILLEGESYGTWEQTLTLLKNTVNSGDNAYDNIMILGRDALTSALDGYMLTVNQLPNLDISNEWYSQLVNDQVTLEDTPLFAFSETCLHMYTASECIYFNKRLLEQYNLGDLYSLVRDNKWTFSELISMAKTATADLDGNGSFDANDQYGISTEDFHFYSTFWISGGTKMIDKNEEGTLYYAALEDERFTDVMTYVLDAFNGQDCVYNQGWGLFTNNNVLFSLTLLSCANTFRSMEDEYGLVPFPMYNEDQGEYYSRVCDGWLYVVPSSCQDAERTSMIMEALACASHQYVWPVYAETAMNYKNLRDEESIEMLDIVRKTVTLDYGDVMWLDLVGTMRESMIKKGSSAISSTIAQLEKTANRLIESTYEKLDKLNEG